MSSVVPSLGSQRNALSPLPRASAPIARAYAKQARASSSGIWVGVFAIAMSFAAFTSALFVREGTTDWAHLALPRVLYFNTVVLLASSLALEKARRVLTEESSRERSANKAGWWVLLTLLLGLGFCVGQFLAWRELRAEGVYLATNPNSSFFYLLTFLHAMHVLVGILVLAYLAARLWAGRGMVRRGLFENTAVYWHFMGVLWVYLLLLCRMKL
jgi:cytochrome c oxidase subunit III